MSKKNKNSNKTPCQDPYYRQDEFIQSPFFNFCEVYQQRTKLFKANRSANAGLTRDGETEQGSNKVKRRKHNLLQDSYLNLISE